jgi:hypothetical protein
MSRRPTDAMSTVDDAPWLSARIAQGSVADGPLIFYYGTPGDDRIVGSIFDDYFDLRQGGSDVAIGRDGSDVFYFGAAFGGSDQVDGGLGDGATDLVVVDGDYSGGVDVTGAIIQNIDRLILNGGPFVITGFLDYRSNILAPVDATSLMENQTLEILVSSRSALNVIGGAGDDILHGALNHVRSYLSGGDGDDYMISEGGRTSFTGGAGADRIVMTRKNDAANFNMADSTATSYDTIDGFAGRAVLGKNKIGLLFDSDTTKFGEQRDFHFGATTDRVGDIVARYDADLGHTIIDVFTDYDKKPDFVLHLTGEITLGIADFQF